MPYHRLAVLILAASQAAFSTRASDPTDTAPQKPPHSEQRTAITITTLRRTHTGNSEHAQLALQRRTFADARNHARVQVMLVRERLREIRFERASPSKEK